jgi:hypothetical protein
LSVSDSNIQEHICEHKYWNKNAHELQHTKRTSLYFVKECGRINALALFSAFNPPLFDPLLPSLPSLKSSSNLARALRSNSSGSKFASSSSSEGGDLRIMSEGDGDRVDFFRADLELPLEPLLSVDEELFLVEDFTASSRPETESGLVPNRDDRLVFLTASEVA